MFLSFFWLRAWCSGLGVRSTTLRGHVAGGALAASDVPVSCRCLAGVVRVSCAYRARVVRVSCACRAGVVAVSCRCRAGVLYASPLFSVRCGAVPGAFHTGMAMNVRCTRVCASMPEDNECCRYEDRVLLSTRSDEFE